jgi:ABC-type glycerol-3-phosphate transport system substrate-binding protein
MTMEGTWQIAEFQEKLGDKVDVFVPPFSDTPIKGIVEYSGDGFAMTNYSKNKTQAAAFLAFMASDEGQKIISDSGIIPDKQGFGSARMAKNLSISRRTALHALSDDRQRHPARSQRRRTKTSTLPGGAQSMKDASTTCSRPRGVPATRRPRSSSWSDLRGASI